MSGRFTPTIQFPLNIEGCKESRLQVEPILCPQGYGIAVKVILVVTVGSGDRAFECERTIRFGLLTQDDVIDDRFAETIYEYLEGLYYNKISQDVVVPLTTLVLKNYFGDLLDEVGLDLSQYFLDFQNKPRKVGYNKQRN